MLYVHPPFLVLLHRLAPFNGSKRFSQDGFESFETFSPQSLCPSGAAPALWYFN